MDERNPCGTDLARPYFNLCSEGKTPGQIARTRKAAVRVAKRYGHLCIDAEACAGWGPVACSEREIDGQRFEVETDTIEDLIAFAAEVNGETVDDVERGIRMRSEYLHNMRTAGRKARGAPPPQPEKKVAPRKRGK